MSEESASRRIRTVAVHGGLVHDAATGAVALPIHMSTTFERGQDGELLGPYLYARYDNPTRHSLEACLAELEGGSSAAAFGSGLAATMAVFQSLKPDDHVVAPTDAYHGTTNQLRDIFAEWGIVATFADMSNISAVEAAITKRTVLVWAESPSNPLMRIADLRAIAELAHAAGARLAVDNTFATPVLQNPLALGADLVVHSTTKYLGGHSDVMGGTVITRENDAAFERIRRIQTLGGAVPSPFDCWLVLRGIRTLPVRMRAHSESAMSLASQLAAHPAIEVVHYPGLASHSGHEVAARQMSAFGGMMSIQVRGRRDAALRAASRVKLFRRASSLGGTESLIEHRATVEGPESKTPDNLLRLSIGLEDPEDIFADLAQALA